MSVRWEFLPELGGGSQDELPIMHRFKKAESPVSVAGGAATGSTSFIMFPVYAAAGMVGRPCAGL